MKCHSEKEQTEGTLTVKMEKWSRGYRTLLPQMLRRKSEKQRVTASLCENERQTNWKKHWCWNELLPYNVHAFISFQTTWKSIEFSIYDIWCNNMNIVASAEFKKTTKELNHLYILPSVRINKKHWFVYQYQIKKNK